MITGNKGEWSEIYTFLKLQRPGGKAHGFNRGMKAR